MQWETATNAILLASILVLAVFAVLGLCQLISRKSLKKVDRPLLAIFVPLALMVITYLVFDKIFILNTRPNGSGEASFPSSHVLVVATIFFCVTLILPRYIKSSFACAILGALMLTLVAIVAYGRVQAHLHWYSDVFGAIVFAAIFTLVYYLIIRRNPHV